MINILIVPNILHGRLEEVKLSKYGGGARFVRAIENRENAVYRYTWVYEHPDEREYYADSWRLAI